VFLNVVYSDKVLTPLTKRGDIASYSKDTDWHILPVAFTQAAPRKNLEGATCFHYDAHVSEVIYNKTMEGAKQFEHVMTYITQKFQDHVRDNFILQRKSVKFYKDRNYKDADTKLRNPKPFVLPAEYDLEVFKRVKAKLEQEAKAGQEVKKENILDASQLSQQMRALKTADQTAAASIQLPGGQKLSQVKQPEKPSAFIQEMSNKMKPNFEVVPRGNEIDVVVHVEAENSAKDIQVDISSTAVKLESEQ